MGDGFFIPQRKRDGEFDYYLKRVKRLGELDFGRKGIIIIDPVEYMLPKNARFKKLKVIDRIDNALFVLEYIPG